MKRQTLTVKTDATGLYTWDAGANVWVADMHLAGQVASDFFWWRSNGERYYACKAPSMPSTNLYLDVTYWTSY